MGELLDAIRRYMAGGYFPPRKIMLPGVLRAAAAAGRAPQILRYERWAASS